MAGYSGDGGPATAAMINQPYGCTVDSRNNIYFTEVVGNRVRKISPSGVITTIGGGGSSLGDGGPASAAAFADPTGIAADKFGNIYIADLLNNRIRKIDGVTNIVSTIAGNGISGSGGDNMLATASELQNPGNVCLDAVGNIYILDGSNRIRKVNASGVITTVVGNGIPGYSGDGGPATAAEIEDLGGVCIDLQGNLYFTQSDFNHIRKVNAAGIITTIAGNGGPSGNTGDDGPATAAGIYPSNIIFGRSGSLFISCKSANNVRVIDNSMIIHTVAGNGLPGFSGDGGSATMAELHSPIGIAVDTCGNLYITDRDDQHIRKVTFYTSCPGLAVNDPAVRESHTYPNPATNILHVHNSRDGVFKIFNLVGKQIIEGEVKTGENDILINTLAYGIYMLVLTDEDGKRTVTKIVKQ